jgi:NAD(P) transhydrogenase subunit alpha
MLLATLIASDSQFTPETLIPALYVFALAAFLGYQVISRVPPLLHTPLMSATNAISGISLVGSIVTAGAQYNTLSTILGFTAVTCATINVVGGFMITDRMLKMFKRKELVVKDKEPEANDKGAEGKK